MHRPSKKHFVLCFWQIQHILRRVLHHQCCKHGAIFHRLPSSSLTDSRSHRHCLTKTALTFERSLQTAIVTAQKEGRGVGREALLSATLSKVSSRAVGFKLCVNSSEKLNETRRCENYPGKHFRARSSRKAFASLRKVLEGQEMKALD